MNPVRVTSASARPPSRMNSFLEPAGIVTSVGSPVAARVGDHLGRGTEPKGGQEGQNPVGAVAADDFGLGSGIGEGGPSSDGADETSMRHRLRELRHVQRVGGLHLGKRISGRVDAGGDEPAGTLLDKDARALRKVGDPGLQRVETISGGREIVVDRVRRPALVRFQIGVGRIELHRGCRIGPEQGHAPLQAAHLCALGSEVCGLHGRCKSQREAAPLLLDGLDALLLEDHAVEDRKHVAGRELPWPKRQGELRTPGRERVEGDRRRKGARAVEVAVGDHFLDGLVCLGHLVLPRDRHHRQAPADAHPRPVLELEGEQRHGGEPGRQFVSDQPHQPLNGRALLGGAEVIFVGDALAIEGEHIAHSGEHLDQRDGIVVGFARGELR